MTIGVERGQYGSLSSKSYLLTFGASDVEEKARNAARQLAPKRKLKGILINLLAAIDEIQAEAGQSLDYSEFTPQFFRNLLAGEPMVQKPVITATTVPDALPDGWVGTVDHVDPDAVRHNLQLRMGNVLDDDDDEDWMN